MSTFRHGCIQVFGYLFVSLSLNGVSVSGKSGKMGNNHSIYTLMASILRKGVGGRNFCNTPTKI